MTDRVEVAWFRLHDYELANEIADHLTDTTFHYHGVSTLNNLITVWRFTDDSDS